MVTGKDLEVHKLHHESCFAERWVKIAHVSWQDGSASKNDGCASQVT